MNRLINFTCYAVFIALGISATLLGPTYESMTYFFQMSLENGGIFTSLQFLGATIGVVIGGRLLDRINARYLMMGGLLLISGGLLLLSAAQILWVALVAVMMFGLGYGVLAVGPNMVIVALNPGREAPALNLLNVFFGVGAIVGPQLVNFALSQDNFRISFIITAVLTMLLMIPSARASAQIKNTSKVQGHIHWLSLLPFALLLFTYVGAEVGYSSWLVTQLTKVALSSAAIATVATSVFWAGLTSGRALATPILRHITDLQLLILSIVTLGFGVSLILAMPTSTAIGIISAFIVGLGCGPVFPTAFAIFSNTYPGPRNVASGLVIAAANNGAVVFPWLQGKIGAGLNGGMILPLILAFIMIGMWAWVQRQTRVPAPVQSSV
jgi:fucose permease